MADIIAIKVINGKTLKQRFSQLGWNLLGTNKNGWIETTPQTIENAIVAEKQKSSGKDQVIKNDLKNSPELPAPVVINEPSKKDIEEFMNHVEGFNKSTIKNFFDEQEPAITYDNKANLQALKDQLGKHFKYDIVELQKAFT